LDESGQLQGYAKVMRDLTARREAEEQLRESEERFRLFVENVSDYALIPVDEHGNVSGWNVGAERRFGYKDSEILGSPVTQFFTPEDNAVLESERDLGLALTDGRAEYERYMVRKDGTRFWARWMTTPMRDSQGHLRGFAKLLRDETDSSLEVARWLPRYSYATALRELVRIPIGQSTVLYRRGLSPSDSRENALLLVTIRSVDHPSIQIHWMWNAYSRMSSTSVFSTKMQN
jgi:PAS domain S-box-containing protein